jgi:uncharacterized membrane protein
MNKLRFFGLSSGCLIGLSVFANIPYASSITLIIVFLVTSRNPQMYSIQKNETRLKQFVLLGVTILLSAKLFVAVVISQLGTLSSREISRSWINDSLIYYSSFNFIILVICFVSGLVVYSYYQKKIYMLLRPSHDISEFNLGPKNQLYTTLDHLDVETKKRLNDADIHTAKDLMGAKNNTQQLRELSKSTGLSIKKIVALPLK